MARGGGQQRIFDAISDVVRRRAYDKASAATELLLGHFAALGGVRREADDLVVGTHVLNRDRQILPRMSEATGLGFAVYLGNRRVATATCLDAGTAPPVGEFAEPSLIDAVLRRGETLQGKVEYDGRPYLVVARALRSSEGDAGAPIGILEAFQDEQASFDILSSTARASLQFERDQMAARADAMESIINFIDDLARRLQLLSLNGNIIAAQAGEHGRAFRVVCRELGDLAEQSKLTATEIRKLISAMGLDELSSSAELEGFEDLDEPETAEAESVEI